MFKKAIEWIKSNKTAIYRLLYLLVSFFVAYLIFEYKEAFSNFGAALLLDAIAISIIVVWDKLTPNFNLITELENGNIAVAIALLAYAVVIGCANIAAFSLFGHGG